MKINNSIYILLFFFSLQYYIIARQHQKYYLRELENELIDIINENRNLISTDYLDSFEQSNLDENEADPNDRVDIVLWNKLNHDDIKNMPEINDYSDETTAVRWLKWHTRVSLRYHQVYDQNNNFSLIVFIFIGISCAQLELSNKYN